MTELGSLDELPADYRTALTGQNLVPLWPSMRALLPHGKPACRTRALAWRYQSIRPLLLEAGRLTPMERAERRVLVLANPGHGLDNMQATPGIYLGLQLVLPGETAPNHRHTPSAVRIIVEGEGASTIVDGERCRMARGDLILTPSGQWHDHRQEGDGPVIWLDVLDLPLIHYLEGSWAIEGDAQTVTRERDKSGAEYRCAGIVPDIGFARSTARTPQLRFPWTRTRDCLLALAREHTDSLLRVAYVNPENGQDLFPGIGFGAIMLRPGETRELPTRTTSCVFHVVAGDGEFAVGQQLLSRWTARDSFVAPGYSDIRLVNRASDEPAFLITADEAPLHRAIGLY